MLVGSVASGEPRDASLQPPPSLYSAVWQGPTNHLGLGAPDQGAEIKGNIIECKNNHNFQV
jgi:hypothetical protein